MDDHVNSEAIALRRIAVILDTEREHLVAEAGDGCITVTHIKRRLTITAGPSMEGACFVTWQIRKHKWGWLPHGWLTHDHVFSDATPIAASLSQAVEYLRGGTPKRRVRGLIRFLAGEAALTEPDITIMFDPQKKPTDEPEES